MTTSTSLEMYIILTIAAAFVTAGLTALGYFIRSWFERIMLRLDEISRQRTECRETLPERFADKQDTKSGFTRVWDRLDEHEGSIRKIEGRMNGGGHL